eukprot:scaffold285951_cov18-Tisochrysis_lutea.AAC.1
MKAAAGSLSHTHTYTHVHVSCTVLAALTASCPMAVSGGSQQEHTPWQREWQECQGRQRLCSAPPVLPKLLWRNLCTATTREQSLP